MDQTPDRDIPATSAQADEAPRATRLLPASPGASFAFGCITGALVVLAVVAFARWNSGSAFSPVRSAEETATAAAQAGTTATSKAVADTGGSITVDSESIDFGRISQDAPVEHILTVTNSGTGDLIIEEVRST